jgi:hypothetical protein
MKSGGGGQGGTATGPGRAGEHPGVGSEERTDGGFMLGGLSMDGSAGGGAGYFGGGAGGGGDTFINSGSGGGGGGTSYFDPKRAIYVASRLVKETEPGDHDPYIGAEHGSVQVFGASEKVATISTNAQVALAPITGWWSCGPAGKLHIRNARAQGTVQVVSYIQGNERSWMITPDKDRGAFVLTGYWDQVISQPALITSWGSYRVSAMFVLREPKQFWYLRLFADRDELQFASPGRAEGSFFAHICTRCAEDGCD